MLHLPRGKTVRPQVNPARINLPQAMEKLRRGRFSGYLRFDDAQGAGLVLFQDGHLIDAVFDGEDRTGLIAFDALTRIFSLSIAGHARLNIYHIGSDLALHLHALLRGTVERSALDVRQLDVAGLQRQISSEGLSACLRVYTDADCTLIFYDQGKAQGFFVDGAAELQQQVEVADSIAAKDGARLDVVLLPDIEKSPPADLMAVADLQPVWQGLRHDLLGR